MLLSKVKCWAEYIKTAQDKKLRGEQKASFGAVYRSCTYQIAMLRIIVEQIFEWWFSFYVKFKDLQKAFDSFQGQQLL